MLQAVLPVFTLTPLFDVSRKAAELDSGYRHHGVIQLDRLISAARDQTANLPTPRHKDNWQCDPVAPQLARERDPPWRHIRNGAAASRSLRYSDIGVGFMMRSLHGKASDGTRHMESSLLHAHLRTWMYPAGEHLEVAVLADWDPFHCPKLTGLQIGGMRSVPSALDTFDLGLATIHWWCYMPNYSSAVDAHAQNFKKLTSLLEIMLQSMPAKHFYIKLDLDCVVVLGNLMRMLRFFHDNLLPGSAVYFGSAGRKINSAVKNVAEAGGKNIPENFAMWRISNGTRDGLFRRPEWQQLVRELFGAEAEQRSSSTATHTQGGFEGMSRAALKRIVSTDCIARVGSVPCDRNVKKSCIHRAEDMTMGLCQYLSEATLVDCFACFKNWIINVPSVSSWLDEAISLDGTKKAKMCPNMVSLHPVKNATEFAKIHHRLVAREQRMHPLADAEPVPPSVEEKPKDASHSAKATSSAAGAEPAEPAASAKGKGTGASHSASATSSAKGAEPAEPAASAKGKQGLSNSLSRVMCVVQRVLSRGSCT